MADPSIFVTYHDAQAYPEYRIRFTQARPAQGHPRAGQARPPGYRPNLLEGVEDVSSGSIDAASSRSIDGGCTTSSNKSLGVDT